MLVFSMTLLLAYGFFMLPDTPLLFFTALFLLIYKQFLSSPGVLVSLAMGVVMAALMYSKYHAVLVIFFVLLSNIKLVFNKYAWLAVIVSLVCYTPHFLWLYENDFVSVKYHLFERPNRAYEFADFTLGYFVNLLSKKEWDSKHEDIHYVCAILLSVQLCSLEGAYNLAIFHINKCIQFSEKIEYVRYLKHLKSVPDSDAAIAEKQQFKTANFDTIASKAFKKGILQKVVA